MEKKMRTFDLEEVKDFIRKQSPSTKIYLGCDSSRYRDGNSWYAEYTTVIVVHIDGHRGCKIFAEITNEKDYDQKKNRPQIRLMNEVYKVSQMYQQLVDVFFDREVQIHLDINPDEKYGSNIVINQAIGYVRGTCDGITPQVKPDALAASYAADRWTEIRDLEYSKI